MSNSGNAITLLQSLQTFFTNLEADNLRTGVPEIDAQTRALITTRLDIICGVVWDGGSRAQQNTKAAATAAANNGAIPAQDVTYRQLDDFVRAVAAQIAVLQNPTSIPRRVQTPLL